MTEFNFTDECIENLANTWPLPLSAVQMVVRDAANQARLDGLVEATEHLVATKHMGGASALHALLTVKLADAKRELAARRIRFEEEKPPMGHHAPPRDDKEIDE
jgi:hypothetical protein